MISVTARYFAAFRERAGRDREALTTDARTAAELYAELARKHGFADSMTRCKSRSTTSSRLGTCALPRATRCCSSRRLRAAEPLRLAMSFKITPHADRSRRAQALARDRLGRRLRHVRRLGPRSQRRRRRSLRARVRGARRDRRARGREDRRRSARALRGDGRALRAPRRQARDRRLRRLGRRQRRASRRRVRRLPLHHRRDQAARADLEERALPRRPFGLGELRDAHGRTGRSASLVRAIYSSQPRDVPRRVDVELRLRHVDERELARSPRSSARAPLSPSSARTVRHGAAATRPARPRGWRHTRRGGYPRPLSPRVDQSPQRIGIDARLIDELHQRARALRGTASSPARAISRAPRPARVGRDAHPREAGAPRRHAPQHAESSAHRHRARPRCVVAIGAPRAASRACSSSGRSPGGRAASAVRAGGTRRRRAARNAMTRRRRPAWIRHVSDYTQRRDAHPLRFAHADEAPSIASMSRHLVEYGLKWSWNERASSIACATAIASCSPRAIGAGSWGSRSWSSTTCTRTWPARRAAGLSASGSRPRAARMARGVRAHGGHFSVRLELRASNDGARASTSASVIARWGAKRRTTTAARTRCGCCTISRLRRAPAPRRHDRGAARAQAARDRRPHGLRHARRDHGQVRRFARRALACRGSRARREGDRARRRLRDPRDRLGWIADAKVEVSSRPAARASRAATARPRPRAAARQSDRGVR